MAVTFTKTATVSGVLAAAGLVTVATLATVATVAWTTAAPAATTSGDPQVNADVKIQTTSLTDASKPGDSYTTYLSVHDNVTNTDGDGSGQCAVVSQVKEGALVTRCLTILRLPDGEVTINGMFTRNFPVKYKGAVLGGTGRYKDIHGEADIVRPDKSTISFKINMAPSG